MINTNIGPLLQECVQKEDGIFKALYINYEVKSAIKHKIWIPLWTNELYEECYLEANSHLTRYFPPYMDPEGSLSWSFFLISFDMGNTNWYGRQCFLNLNSSVINYAVTYLYSQLVNIKANEVWEITTNALSGNVETSSKYTCTLVTYNTDIRATLISKRVTWPPYYCLLSEATNRLSGASRQTWNPSINESSSHTQYVII